jgi:hypothetical protein
MTKTIRIALAASFLAIGISAHARDETMYPQGHGQGQGHHLAYGHHSKLVACYKASLNAVLVFEDVARDRGANAIMGIVSHDDDLPDVSSETRFRCNAGSFRSSVGFKARFVKLASVAPVNPPSAEQSRPVPAPGP